jgi:hypothetical protein
MPTILKVALNGGLELRANAEPTATRPAPLGGGEVPKELKLSFLLIDPKNPQQALTIDRDDARLLLAMLPLQSEVVEPVQNAMDVFEKK